MISVIIPTFNREKLISHAINSVLTQTYPVLEILVCDDGSTDNTESVVNSFNNEKIKYIKCDHSGKPAVPRNVAITKAKGNWIAFLDSDDEWLPHKLESQMSLLNKYELKAICSNALRVDSNKKNQGDYLQNSRSRKFGFGELLHENVIICSSVLIEKKLIDKCGLFNEEDEFRAIEDYLLWLKVAKQSQWYYVSESLLKYNDDFTNSIRSTDVRRGDEQKRLILDYLEKWISKDDFINYSLIVEMHAKNKSKKVRLIDKFKRIFKV